MQRSQLRPQVQPAAPALRTQRVEGRVLITQRGVVRDPEADLQGAVRLAQPPDEVRSSGST